MKTLHIVLVAVMAFQIVLFTSTLIEARPFLEPDTKCSSWWMGSHGGSRLSPPPPPSHAGGPTPKLQYGPTLTKPRPRPRVSPPPPPPRAPYGPTPFFSYNIYHLRATTPALYRKAASA